MSDWRQNQNLVECYENVMAMLHGRSREPTGGKLIRQRRLALGLTQFQLAIAAGYSPATARSIVSAVEQNRCSPARVSAALDRLEAERSQS